MSSILDIAERWRLGHGVASHAMLFAVRTTLEALVDGDYSWMPWATPVSFVLGAFVLGPIVQWYAFRVWWSGSRVLPARRHGADLRSRPSCPSA